MVVIDEDHEIFNVFGPMTDDTNITHRVYIGQVSGRKVRTFSENGQSKREEVINSMKTQSRYKYSIVPIV